MIAPTLTTERLVLRPLQMADFASSAGFLATERSRFMGGPHDTARAWDWFCNDTAQWALLDMGALMITHLGQVVGQVALCHGPVFPEPELGWFLYDGAGGRGFATEAAVALRDWGFGVRGLATMVSYIDPANAASVKVAERLGARIDPLAATPGNKPTLAYRLVVGGATC